MDDIIVLDDVINRIRTNMERRVWNSVSADLYLIYNLLEEWKQDGPSIDYLKEEIAISDLLVDILDLFMTGIIAANARYEEAVRLLHITRAVEELNE